MTPSIKIISSPINDSLKLDYFILYFAQLVRDDQAFDDD